MSGPGDYISVVNVSHSQREFSSTNHEYDPTPGNYYIKSTPITVRTLDINIQVKNADRLSHVVTLLVCHMDHGAIINQVELSFGRIPGGYTRQQTLMGRGTEDWRILEKIVDGQQYPMNRSVGGGRVRRGWFSAPEMR